MTTSPPHSRWGWTGRNVTALILLTALTAVMIGWRMLGRPARMDADLVVIDAAMPAAAETIDPNTASWASLARLPGIGPGRARAICAYREQFDGNGPAFASAEDLTNVPGIGPITLEGIRPYLSFTEPDDSGGAEARPPVTPWDP